MHITLSLAPELSLLVHQIFEALGIFIGAFYYRSLKKHLSGESIYARGNFAIVVGCVLGAATGNKLLYWFEHPQLWSLLMQKPLLFFQGQSIVGGLVGGLLGVELSKKWLGVNASTGDLFVGPVLMGLAIGRVGCFFAGLNDETYGVPTQLPWAVDFGDGIGRHPTQIYEIVFVLSLWYLLESSRGRLAAEPGLLFKLMLSSYLLWRLLVDFIKPLAYDLGLGMGAIQWLCVLTLAVYLPRVVKSFLRWRLHGKGVLE